MGPFVRKALIILWPAFLMAGVMMMLVFSMVEPSALHGLGGGPLQLSDTAVYTLAFFAFWLVIALACAATSLLDQPREVVNDPVASRAWRA